MERYGVKLIFAFVILVVSYISSLLPFILSFFKTFHQNKSSKPEEIEEEFSSASQNTHVTNISSTLDVSTIEKPPNKKKFLQNDQNHPQNHTHHNSRLLNCLLCLGGGVFLGAFLLHMIPEVQETFRHSFLSTVDYPLDFFFISIGFFLVLSVDILVGFVQRWRLKKGKQNNTSHSFYVSHEHDSSDHHHHHHHHHQHHHATHSIVLLLALSLHHLFEGLSIGLMAEFDHVWKLGISVLIHEVAICFSMGLQLFKSDKRLGVKVALFLLVFSIILPIGLFIGIIITEMEHWHDEKTQKTISAILQALSSGSFLYVTFFEILFEQLSVSRHIVLKTIFVFFGFVIEALLAIAGHDHGNEHTESGETNSSAHDDHDH